MVAPGEGSWCEVQAWVLELQALLQVQLSLRRQLEAQRLCLL